MAKSGFEIRLGGFEPYLVESIIDALTPKAVRQQMLRQAALSTLARLQPIFRDLPEEEKKDLYTKFFKAYGMAEPPFWRGLFGAGAEPILPLPEGTKVKTERVWGLFGPRTRTVYEVPQTKPFHFPSEPEKPLLSESRKKELEGYLKEAGYGPEEIRDYFVDLVTGVGKSEAAQKARIKERAFRWIKQHMEQTGATEEEAREALKRQQPVLGTRFGEIEEEEGLMKHLRASLITSREEKSQAEREKLRLREEELERRKALDEFNQRLALRRQAFAEQAHRDRMTNKREAVTAKNKAQLLSLMQKAYDRFIMRIQREVAEAHKLQKEFKRFYPDYPMEEIKPYFPKFEEWLADEGRPFLLAASEMGITEAELFGIKPPKEAPKVEPERRPGEAKPQKLSPEELLREENEFRRRFGLPLRGGRHGRY